MKLLILAIAVAFAMPNAMAASNAACTADETYKEVTKAELQKWVAEKSVFTVDANGKKSFDKTHIGNAIDYKTLKSEKGSQDAFATQLPKDKNALIVAYCGGPSCEAWKEAAEEACNLGYTNVRHFKGGIKAWTDKKWLDKKI
ncbi:MAG: rhodanese-like domain-containing protein [Bdellovibrionales bacterium]